MSIVHRWFENSLLRALPDDVRQRLAPSLALVTMPVGQVLHEPGAAMSAAYFPLSSIVAKLFVMEDGHSAPVALVGHEGVVGVSLFLGGVRPTSQASVQSAGQGLRLPAHRLQEEFGRGGALMQVLLRHTQNLIAHIMQTAACNYHGTLEQRLCRWLLLSLDRSSSSELRMTHELIANGLGVRREGVTEAASRLQRQGAIRYHRGHISVLDRTMLERQVCDCYGAAPLAAEDCALEKAALRRAGQRTDRGSLPS
jgi:CRP-like cAMP-binding protein